MYIRCYKVVFYNVCVYLFKVIQFSLLINLFKIESYLMAEYDKYYNPEYPETSNEWTRKWDKSWLLSKDKYLLNFGNEKERKDSYRYRMFRVFVLLFLPQIALLLPFGLNIYTVLISILGYVIGCRLYFLLVSIFNILLFIVLPIYVFLHLGEQIHYFWSFFAYFFLIQGICFVIYAFYKVYLKEFDTIYFRDLYKSISKKDDPNSNFIRVDESKKILTVITFFFKGRYLDMCSVFVFIKPYIGKVKKNILLELIKIEYFRLVFAYGWIYLFREDFLIKKLIKILLK